MNAIIYAQLQFAPDSQLVRILQTDDMDQDVQDVAFEILRQRGYFEK